MNNQHKLLVAGSATLVGLFSVMSLVMFAPTEQNTKTSQVSPISSATQTQPQAIAVQQAQIAASYPAVDFAKIETPAEAKNEGRATTKANKQEKSDKAGKTVEKQDSQIYLRTEKKHLKSHKTKTSSDSDEEDTPVDTAKPAKKEPDVKQPPSKKDTKDDIMAEFSYKSPTPPASAANSASSPVVTTKPAAKQPNEPRQVFASKAMDSSVSVLTISNGKAWVKTSPTNTLIATPGSDVPGYGKVKSVSNSEVVFESGQTLAK